MPTLVATVLLLVAAGLALLVKRYRNDPARRAVIVTIIKDPAALAVGGAVTVVLLVWSAIDGGMGGLIRELVLALAAGLLVATLVHRFRAHGAGG